MGYPLIIGIVAPLVCLVVFGFALCRMAAVGDRDQARQTAERVRALR